jgi:hypothetical protein
LYLLILFIVALFQTIEVLQYSPSKKKRERNKEKKEVKEINKEGEHSLATIPRSSVLRCIAL